MISALAPRVTHRLELSGSDAPARQARHAVQADLEARGLGCADPAIEECAGMTMLIVSELVTNATRHSHGPQEMRIRWDGQQLTLEVDDDTPAAPRIRPPSERGETGGFGMDLIDQLSDSWGTRPRPDHCTGKTVYVCIIFPPLPA
ncbi:ATP-binding protein [Streptomyces sp. NPDC008121]|uniref:ATP-binding protein n=1 Tax=Streptomyces sp. NPDC008121 TaxID=3364809 RepID=UPI0036E1CED6